MMSFLSKCVAYAIAIPAVLIVMVAALIGLFFGVVWEGCKLGLIIGRFVTTQAIVASKILEVVAVSHLRPTLQVIKPDPEEEECNDLPS